MKLFSNIELQTTTLSRYDHNAGAHVFVPKEESAVKCMIMEYSIV